MSVTLPMPWVTLQSARSGWLQGVALTGIRWRVFRLEQHHIQRPSTGRTCCASCGSSDEAASMKLNTLPRRLQHGQYRLRQVERRSRSVDAFKAFRVFSAAVGCSRSTSFDVADTGGVIPRSLTNTWPCEHREILDTMSFCQKATYDYRKKSKKTPLNSRSFTGILQGA